jgi:hypothetical protein
LRSAPTSKKSLKILKGVKIGTTLLNGVNKNENLQNEVIIVKIAKLDDIIELQLQL